MNRLPINPAAEAKYAECCRKYYKDLLARAHIYALLRSGSSIDIGDFERAYNDMENQGRRTQLLLASGSAAIGAGLSGIFQNALDGKSWTFLAVFAVLLLIGGVSAYLALFRR